MTILFSTHVLHDAEQVCDSVIMLKEGTIKWDGSLTDLKNNQSASAIKISTAEAIDGCFAELPQLSHIEYKDLHTAVLYFDEPAIDTSLLLNRLLENNLTLLHFEHVQDSLEDAYLRMMNQ